MRLSYHSAMKIFHPGTHTALVDTRLSLHCARVSLHFFSFFFYLPASRRNFFSLFRKVRDSAHLFSCVPSIVDNIPLFYLQDCSGSVPLLRLLAKSL